MVFVPVWVFVFKMSQYSKSSKEFSKEVLALSWKIATEPLLYRKLASNPYSPSFREIIEQRFYGVKHANVVKAVILADPEDKNDLRVTPQKLHKDSVDAHIREYYKKNQKELRGISRHGLYDKLMNLVFGTTSLKEIEERFSREERVNYRLSIVNFIENKFNTGKIFLKLVSGFIPLLILFSFTQAMGDLTDPPKKMIEQTLGVETQNIVDSPFRMRSPKINLDITSEHLDAVESGVIRGEQVFSDLNKLEPGDYIYITTGGDGTVIYRVKGSRFYSSGYNGESFGFEGKNDLVMIAPGGLAVFADRE
jgi:hypothetical protein